SRSHAQRTPTVQATHARRPLTQTLWQRVANLSAPTRVVILILLVAAAVRFAALNGLSDDYDEGVYWQSLRAMTAGHQLFTSVFSSQPPFFLLSVYPFYTQLGQTIFAARLGIAIYSLLGLIAIYIAGRLIAGAWGGVVACALLAFDPLYFRESHTLQAEIPSLVFALIAVALAAWAARLSDQAEATRSMAVGGVRGGVASQWHALLVNLLSGVALGLGEMAKLWDVVALIPILAYAFAPELARLESPQSTQTTQESDSPGFTVLLYERLRAAVAPVVALALGVALALLAILAPFAASFSQMYTQVVTFHTAAGQVQRVGLSQNLSIILGSNLYLTGIAAVVALALAVWRGFARDAAARRPLLALRMAPPALWALASFVLLLAQHPLFAHHIALLAPPLALMAALAAPLATGAAPTARLHILPSRRARRKKAAGLAPTTSTRLALVWSVTGAMTLITLISLSLGVVSDQAASQPLPTTTQTIVAALHLFTAPGDLVAGDDQYLVALANRSTPPQLVDTSQVRISSGYLTASQLEGIITKDDVRYILFASGRFALIPGFSAWVKANCVQLANFGAGRTLWERQPPGPVLA
ncbi:MAG TPA: hypothetical protein VKQ36_13785, partial [Ktedonobacterales bacterium]|nr:hypothetical protein [Ktedonobacterales bacterium]